MSFNIMIDATQLMFRVFIVPGHVADWTDARVVQAVSLDPGVYSVQVVSGSYADFVFVVTPSGSVDFDRRCDLFLSGRGTNTLIIQGVDVRIDARLLSGAGGNGVGGVLFADAPLTNDDWISLKTVRLVPGAYRVQQSSGRVASFNFAVGNDGTVTYDASYSSFVSGSGTSTLALRGYKIDVDATACSSYLYVQPGWAFPVSHSGQVSLILLPAEDFYLQLDRGLTDITFSVSVSGEVPVRDSMRDLLEVVQRSGVMTVVVKAHAAFDSPIYGSSTVRGILYDKWRQTGGQRLPNGQTVQEYLGLAVEEARTISASARTHVLQRFERGMLADVVGRNNPVAVYGITYLRYNAMGAMTGILGAPTRDEVALAGGGRRAPFEFGEVYSHVETGAFEIHGEIRRRWLQIGGPSGRMGYPISNEAAVMNRGSEIGRVSQFESRSRDIFPAGMAYIYWSPDSGAWEIFGPILDHWKEVENGPIGRLGFPTGEPHATPNGSGRYQTFKNGLIVWHGDTGAVTAIGGVALRQWEFTVSDDDFNVQIRITSQFGMEDGPENHGRMPADGQYHSGSTNLGGLDLLVVDKVTPDLVIQVEFMEAISERTLGEDRRVGNITANGPIVYDIENAWGINEVGDYGHHDGGFSATFRIQPLEQPIDESVPFRQQRFWPFANFNTPELSWHQYEATYSDVAEVDKHISIIPPRMHLLEIAVYEVIYRSFAEKGNCFAMCLEAIYARQHRSLFIEPIFVANGYRHDGQKLVPDGATPTPANAPVANILNIKMGYQIGADQIMWFLGKFLAGALHDPLRAFRESRDAYKRGDWPMLSVGEGTGGHVVLPYKWDPPSEPNHAPLPGSKWTIYVANPNSPPRIPDDHASCKIVIDPFLQTYELKRGPDDDANVWYRGSKGGGGRLLTMPYSVYNSQPTSPADLIFDLFKAGVLIVLAGAGKTNQVRDGGGRNLYELGPDGTRRVIADPAIRIPNVTPIPTHSGVGAAADLFWWQPDRSGPVNLQHAVEASGDYMWSVHSAAMSVHVVATGGIPGDELWLTDPGTPTQKVSIKVPSNGARKTIQISMAGWSGTDLAHAKWFELVNIQMEPAQTLQLQVLQAGRTASVHTEGSAASFDCFVHFGLDDTSPRTAPGLNIPAGKTWRMSPGWTFGAMASSVIYIEEKDSIEGPTNRSFVI